MKVTYIDHMGSDLTVVNAARVSFAKHHDNFDDQDDAKLIRYLARHNHWSPFAHAFISFRIQAPIFVARQLQKHTVGLAWNEVSRRYVDDAPTFFTPDSWRGKAENVKQGSSDHIVTPVYEGYDRLIETAEYVYKKMIEKGICPEQARMILPQSMNTEWIWSGSLYAFSRVVNLRADSHTQRETQFIANEIKSYLIDLFPVSMEAICP